MNSSPDIKDIATALCKVQTDLQAAIKDASNPHFKSKYATLEAVWDVIRAPLVCNGLSVVQPVRYEQGFNGVIVQTILMHGPSGQWIASDVPIPTAKLTPQEMGAAISYGRRYGLAALIGVTQEDDDAQQATSKMNKPTPVPAPKPVQTEPTPEQKAVIAIMDNLEAYSLTPEQFTAITGMKSLKGQTVEALNAALAVLMEYVDSKGAA